MILAVVAVAFVALQTIRLRRALHVFQLEGYKRARFLRWARRNPRRSLYLSRATGKKPLVMTGRARRILSASVAITAAACAGAIAAAVAAGGTAATAWIAGAMAMVALFFTTSETVALGDVVMSPLQKRINERFLDAARARLRELAPTVVGVTGSFGKTSTKFAVQSLLGEGVALATPGSFNTPLGVCRTINERLASAHEYFVVEMGAYHEGEIAELCRFVHPTVGVLTAIGPAHLERFGSMDAIRRAKYELIQSLPADGAAVMNVDDLEVRRLADRTRHVPVLRYGLEAAGQPHVTARDVSLSSEGTVMTIAVGEAATLTVRTKLLGRHAIGHVLAGVAVAKFAGYKLADLRAAIEAMEPVEHRLQLIHGAGGVTVIDDAYNSNPHGAAAALEVLAAMPGRRKVVVTPGMIELGPLQLEENRRFGERAGAIADTVIAVARTNRAALSEGVESGGGPGKLIVVDSLAEATEKLASLLGPGDVVLFENDLPDHFEA